MYVKKLWLDLELRENVDDFFTLVYALENRFPIEVISIVDPTINELKLINYTLTLFNRKDIPFLLYGSITERTDKEDVSPFLLSLCENYKPIQSLSMNNFMYDVDMGNMTVFCGGSLEMLSDLVLLFKNNAFDSIAQGCFSDNVDIDQANTVIQSEINKFFVSKDVSNDAFIYKNDIKDVDSIFSNLLYRFLEDNKIDSYLMPNLLTLLTVIDQDLVCFAPSKIKNLKHDKGITMVSKSFDKDKFLKIIKINNEGNL